MSESAKKPIHPMAAHCILCWRTFISDKSDIDDGTAACPECGSNAIKSRATAGEPDDD